jgi:hypothetical protein
MFALEAYVQGKQEEENARDNTCDPNCFMASGIDHILYVGWIYSHPVGHSYCGGFDSGDSRSKRVRLRKPWRADAYPLHQRHGGDHHCSIRSRLRRCKEFSSVMEKSLQVSIRLSQKALNSKFK